jgi:GYF domain
VKKSVIELKTLLLKMMKPGENVVQAMRRMSGKQSLVGKAKKRLPKSQNVDTAEVMPETETKEQKLANRLALEEFSDLTDELLSRGLSGVYDMTYEAIENSAVRWEYRGLDGVVQGPFPPQTIAAWKAQGYFSGSSAVMMRKVGTIGKDWDGNQENPMSKSNQINGKDGDAGRNSSSTATASTAGKVRFNFDADSSVDQKSKKAKIEVSATAESTTQDLMDDLEDGDDDDEINEKSGISVDPVVSTKTEIVPIIDNLVRGEWMSSDDIEFEVTLEVEEKKEEDVEADVDDDEDDI